jgi:hypothetical protein
MAGRTGADGQIGFGAETTWGTAVTPTRFLAFNSENIKLDNPLMRSAGIKAGSSRVLGTDRVRANPKGASGDVNMEVGNKGMGLLYKHMFGASAGPVTPSGGTTTRDYEFTLADPTGLGLTVQVGRPSINNTVNPFTYPGGKIATWELAQNVDEFLTLTLGVDASTEDTVTALAAASYPSAVTLFAWQDCVLTIDGTPYDFESATIAGSMGLKTDRYSVRGSGNKKEQLPTDFIGITGTLSSEFQSTAQYAKFVAGTPSQFIFTWTGGVIEGSFNFRLRLTLPAVKYSGDTPEVGGPDILTQELPWEAFYDGSNPPAKLELRTTDTTL